MYDNRDTTDSDSVAYRERVNHKKSSNNHSEELVITENNHVLIYL